MDKKLHPSGRLKLPTFEVDLNVVKDFNRKYEEYKHLRNSGDGHYEIFKENNIDKSISSIQEQEHESYEKKSIIEVDDEEFYMTHKRNKIKTKLIPDYHYNASSTKLIRLPAWKLNKPQKINTVIENYQKREKMLFPNTTSSRKNYTKATDFVGIDGELQSAVKRKLKVMSILVLKDNNKMLYEDLEMDDKAITEYENIAKLNALNQTVKNDLSKSKLRSSFSDYNTPKGKNIRLKPLVHPNREIK